MPSKRNGHKRSRNGRRKVSPNSSTYLTPTLSSDKGRRKSSRGSIHGSEENTANTARVLQKNNLRMSSPLQQAIRSTRTVPRILYAVDPSQQARPRSASRAQYPSGIYLGRYFDDSSTKSLVQNKERSRMESSSERLLRQLDVSSGIMLKKVPSRYDLRSATFFHRGVRLRRRRRGDRQTVTDTNKV